MNNTIATVNANVNANAVAATHAPAPDVLVANVEEVPTTAVSKAASAGRKTPNYTPMQDLLVSEAFIIASEDAEKGSSQKGATFKNAIAKAYITVRAAQLQLDQESYQTSARIERSVNYAMGTADAPPNESIVDAGSAVAGVRTTVTVSFTEARMTNKNFSLENSETCIGRAVSASTTCDGSSKSV
jgi:hypothetical protein